MMRPASLMNFVLIAVFTVLGVGRSDALAPSQEKETEKQKPVEKNEKQEEPAKKDTEEKKPTDEPKGPKEKPTSRPAPVEGTEEPTPEAKKPEKIAPVRASSAREVADKVVAAINARDLTALRALLVDEKEYEEVLWPGFVEQRPHLAKQRWKLHWYLLANKSLAGSGDLLQRYKGVEKLEILSMTHEKIEDYGKFKLWRNVYLELSLDGKKTEKRRIFGAIIERDGKFYLLSYPS